MKRILGTVVALAALLAFGEVSSAAIITYDLTGTGGGAAGSTYQSASSLAPVPPGYFTSLLTVGSNITINTDANGDGTVGDVSVVGGTVRLDTVTDLGAYGLFISNVTTHITGGTGSLSGTQILWSTPTSFDVDPASTFGCTEPICTILGLTEGVVYPISAYQAFTASQGVTPINPALMATWQLTPTGFQSLGATFVSDLNNNPAQPVNWYIFNGNAVPEPGAIALVLLGLGGIALRSRKA